MSSPRIHLWRCCEKWTVSHDFTMKTACTNEVLQKELPPETALPSQEDELLEAAPWGWIDKTWKHVRKDNHENENTTFLQCKTTKTMKKNRNCCFHQLVPGCPPKQRSGRGTDALQHLGANIRCIAPIGIADLCRCGKDGWGEQDWKISSLKGILYFLWRVNISSKWNRVVLKRLEVKLCISTWLHDLNWLGTFRWSRSSRDAAIVN